MTPARPLPSRWRLVAALAAAVALAAVPGTASATADAVAPPPPNAQFDYQIGGGYSPPQGVQVVSRDREDDPAPGLYNICYVNAFQTQPDDLGWWEANHRELLLTDSSGEYVVDSEWGEVLLDIRTPEKRATAADVVGGWIAGCADGFQAVEPDNIDTYDRSQGLLTRDQALAYVALLADRAHAEGLAIAQKNTADFGTDGRDAGLDFAIVEQCGEFTECGDFTAVYGANVIGIEYDREHFDSACSSHGDEISIVLRDLFVTPPSDPAYVYDAC
jgi:hypothetical protein